MGALGMAAARSLQPQDQIAHYVIVTPLGVGGMGEVYLAQDQTLGRKVALKILPPELVQRDDRVRRFVREAKSASSLNHPNIVTIYEIGESSVRRAEPGMNSTSPSSSLHYIAMELVAGETLATKIQDRTPLETLVAWLAQAADGLASAHQAGIVHRDLKPSNIMVSKDGFTKVLDFGLAKLVEAEATSTPPSAATATAPDTRPDSVVGTVGYMSPEQVRGAPVDHRSDVFSFGCILYEAATGTRAFAGDSSVETLHRILHDKPEPIEAVNPSVPAELRRLIRRCLAKNPDERPQSTRDLANGLHEIAEEWDTLALSSGSGSAAGTRAARPRSARRLVAMIAGAAAIAAFVILGVTRLRDGGHAGSRITARSIRTTIIPIRGLVIGLAMSPDARFMAYSQLSDGNRSLWVRQLATGSDVQLLAPPLLRPPNHLSFSPDGNFLYYVMGDPQRNGVNDLFAIPTLGGTPRRRATDVDSRASFSPDGRRICFTRGVPDVSEDRLIVFDLARKAERVLASVSHPTFFRSPAWSPDGSEVAVVETRPSGSSVAVYRAADGRREMIGTRSWHQAQPLGGLAWLPDGEALVLSASDQATSPNPQLWMVHRQGGVADRLTRDANSYSMITVSSDGKTIAAARDRTEANLWIGSAAHSSLRQLTVSSEEEGSVRGQVAGVDGAIVFETLRGGLPEIHSIREDGTGERKLMEERMLAMSPIVRTGVGIFYEGADRDLVPHVWLADTNGENERALTSGAGERIEDVSPDGQTVLFRKDDVPATLWTVAAGTGLSRLIGPCLGNAIFSPDGKFILLRPPDDAGPGRAGTWHVVPAAGGEPIATPTFPPGSFGQQWSPDGRSITYLNNSNLLRNLYRLKLDGGSPEEITQFTSGRIFNHHYSPDGSRLIFRREASNTVNIWTADASGRNPQAATNFETGVVHAMTWTRDMKHVIFTYGQIGSDGVLIRDFQ